jgi:hypothetical protein
LGLIDPGILRDWVNLYKVKREAAIQTTHGRKSYLNHEENLDQIADKSLKDRLEYLEAENVTKKIVHPHSKEKQTNQEAVKVVCELRDQYSLKYLLKKTRLSKSIFFYTIPPSVSIERRVISILSESRIWL